MTTKSLDVEIQNIVMNHESKPVKSDSALLQFLKNILTFPSFWCFFGSFLSV